MGFDMIVHGYQTPGWVSVALDTMDYDYRAVEDWLNEHTSKRVRYHAALFLFEDAGDATLFSLRWL